ncbi:programmed cell death protein 1 [Varanus komodoensis]|uniref:programmed cell death protein 1 n=1 Tax=Varanus komodoensis TaxID=61221 RepID=UPI001CF7CB88|nr:programmed cell death protein 1 [Varanus komodoensis]
MEDPHQVLLAGACLLLLLCQPALLDEPSPRIWPSQLNLSMGETAVFTCNTSNVLTSQYHLNWYKMDSRGQPERLESSKNTRKYNITRLNSGTFKMQIRNVQKNDSGTYSCTLLAFSLNETLKESNKANLTVTEKPNPEPRPTEEERRKEEEEEEEEEEEKPESGHPNHSTLLVAIGGAGLVVLLVSVCFFLATVLRKRKGQKRSQDENAPLEEEPPGVTVFTVDYGVLQFQAPGTAKKAPPAKRTASEQTEYATIVFPPEKPGPAEADKAARRSPRACPGSRPPR